MQATCRKGFLSSCCCFHFQYGPSDFPSEIVIKRKVKKIIKALMVKFTRTLVVVSLQAGVNRGGKSQKMCSISLQPQKGSQETRMASEMGQKRLQKRKRQVQQPAAIFIQYVRVIIAGQWRGQQTARYWSQALTIKRQHSEAPREWNKQV